MSSFSARKNTSSGDINFYSRSKICDAYLFEKNKIPFWTSMCETPTKVLNIPPASHHIRWPALPGGLPASKLVMPAIQLASWHAAWQASRLAGWQAGQPACRLAGPFTKHISTEAEICCATRAPLGPSAANKFYFSRASLVAGGLVGGPQLQNFKSLFVFRFPEIHHFEL